VDPGQLRGTDAGPRTRPDGRAQPVGVPSPLPGRHRHEPAAVPEAHPAAGGTRAADRGHRRRGPGRRPGRLRQPGAVQPRVPKAVRRPAGAGCRTPPVLVVSR
jgi:hypothetical protein